MSNELQRQPIQPILIKSGETLPNALTRVGYKSPEMEIQELHGRVSELEGQLAEANGSLAQKDGKIKSQAAGLNSLRGKLRRRDDTIVDLRIQLQATPDKETKRPEITKFSPEARAALEERGFEIYELKGESIISLKTKGHPFYDHGWDRDPLWLKKLSSRKMEVAIHSEQLFLPESRNKTLEEQLEMTREFSDRLRIPGVRAVLGEIPEYTELDFLHLGRKGHHLFKPELENGRNTYGGATRTKTRNRESYARDCTYTVGFSSKFSYGLVIGYCPFNYHDYGLYVAPLVVPDNGSETRVREDFGLERLGGLPPKTKRELERIADKLKDPKKAEYLKQHEFRDSNGAVFWGLPGTGKSWSVEALAEETGCERVVLKIDEYMSSFIHGSATALGEKLREVKETAKDKEKPLIVQIDEADTILMPVTRGGTFGDHDISEIRAVLLREFQEQSNVFFILTTNLDPRNPRQADPAIVRNERIGYLVGFAMPDVKGREEIFAKEIGKRSSRSLRWDNVDFESLAKLSEGFAPADIQAVLLTAVNEAYDRKTRSAVVTKQHLEDAVALVKFRKQNEEE